MRKIIFMGRTGCGKTTLTQKMKNVPTDYCKTQYIDYSESIIDTPGEYAETKGLGAALALYSYEADVVGLLISAADEYSLFPPNITCMVNREVVGIVTQIDRANANPQRAAKWLENSGCKRIFFVSSKSGEGIDELKNFLK